MLIIFKNKKETIMKKNMLTLLALLNFYTSGFYASSLEKELTTEQGENKLSPAAFAQSVIGKTETAHKPTPIKQSSSLRFLGGENRSISLATAQGRGLQGKPVAIMPQNNPEKAASAAPVLTESSISRVFVQGKKEEPIAPAKDFSPQRALIVDEKSQNPIYRYRPTGLPKEGQPTTPSRFYYNPNQDEEKFEQTDILKEYCQKIKDFSQDETIAFNVIDNTRRFKGLSYLNIVKGALVSGADPDALEKGIPLLVGAGPRLTSLLLSQGADPYAQDFLAIRKTQDPEVKAKLEKKMHFLATKYAPEEYSKKWTQYLTWKESQQKMTSSPHAHE
jgi:hypothetical protein